MGATHRFLALESESHRVLDWFRSLDSSPTESTQPDGSLFYFRDFGKLADSVADSPLVSVFVPQRKRGVLLTCGEVHFLATPASRFPQLLAVGRRFRTWLSSNTLVFSRNRDFDDKWAYYLEGSIRNFDSDVFAFPGAFDALSNASYFVAHGDSDAYLDSICQQLDNRGVDGISHR